MIIYPATSDAVKIHKSTFILRFFFFIESLVPVRIALHDDGLVILDQVTKPPLDGVDTINYTI